MTVQNKEAFMMNGKNHNRKGPTTKFSRTLPDGTVHSIELPAPTSITMRKILVLEPGKLSKEEAVLELMSMMFNQPEVEYQHYSEYQRPKDNAIEQAIEGGDIIVEKSECYYYKHPEDKRSFIHLNPAEKELSDWEDDLVSRGPSFVKNVLKLSERKKREYETWQKIEMEKAFKKRKQELSFLNDVFLSYSEKDHSIALKIRKKLEKVNASVFMSSKSLRPGDDFADKISKSLLGSSEMWIILSPNSLNSEWVTTEWGAAWVLSKRIIPILYRCDIPQLPERLRRLHCVDVESIDDLIMDKFAQNDKKDSIKGS